MCFQIVDDVLDVTAHARPSSASPPATTCTRACTRCPSSTRSNRRRELRDLLGRKLDWPEVEKVVALVARPDVDRRVARRRPHARDEGERGAHRRPRARRRGVRPAAHARRRAGAALVVSRHHRRTRGAVFVANASRVAGGRCRRLPRVLAHGHGAHVARAVESSPASTRTGGCSKHRSRGRRRCRSTCTTSRVDGDLVLSDWTIRARRCDDGVEVEWRGLSVCELRDDRIVWWREHHLAPPEPVA